MAGPERGLRGRHRAWQRERPHGAGGSAMSGLPCKSVTGFVYYVPLKAVVVVGSRDCAAAGRIARRRFPGDTVSDRVRRGSAHRRRHHRQLDSNKAAVTADGQATA